MIQTSMARSLQVLSLISRFAALSVTPPVSNNIRRFASRVGGSKEWMVQSHARKGTASPRARDMDDDMSDEELEDVEGRLQDLVDEGMKRQKTLKYHILRRQMTPKGAPQRKLTWDAIEQIRFLRQEQPEEWTVERLAEGYSVTPDVILRVLKGKFVPSPERRAKQNAKVMVRLGQQVLPSGTQQDIPNLPENHTPAAILPSGHTKAALVPVADQTPMIRDEGSGSLAKSTMSVPVLPSQLTGGTSKHATVMKSTVDNSTSDASPAEEDEEDEDSWDGQVWTEEELEEFMEMEEPSPVVQVGSEFFDAEGNFLYRI